MCGEAEDRDVSQHPGAAGRIFLLTAMLDLTEWSRERGRLVAWLLAKEAACLVEELLALGEQNMWPPRNSPIREPGMPACMRSARSTGTDLSRRPCRISAGTRMSPSRPVAGQLA